MLTKQMKNSDVEWIGDIPSDWHIKRNKSIFEEINIKSETGEEDLLSVSEYYGVLPRKEVLKKDDNITRSESLVGYKLCESNDLVINIMLAWKRSLGISKWKGIVSPAYAVFRLKNNNDVPEYYDYLFRTDLYAEYFKAYSTGVIDSRLRLYPEKFLSLYSHSPSRQEKLKIVKFLNEKVSQIDTIVRESKQSIEELKKYKKSLITEVVTKGLDKNVQLKDSGFDVIGSVNASYKIIPLGYFGTLQNGISKSSEYFGEGYPFVSYGDVYKNRILPSKVEGLVKSTEEDQLNYSVRKGDILFTRTSETIEEIGMASVCLETIQQATFAGFLIRFRPKNTQELLTEYARYYFDASFIRDFFAKEMNLVTRASLSQPLLKKVPVIIPSIEKQKEIAIYLDEKTSKIDNLISEKQRVIQELEYYKKSLIYEYVTGKKRV